MAKKMEAPEGTITAPASECLSASAMLSRVEDTMQCIENNGDAEDVSTAAALRAEIKKTKAKIIWSTEYTHGYMEPQNVYADICARATEIDKTYFSKKTKLFLEEIQECLDEPSKNPDAVVYEEGEVALVVMKYACERMLKTGTYYVWAWEQYFRLYIEKFKICLSLYRWLAEHGTDLDKCAIGRLLPTLLKLKNLTDKMQNKHILQLFLIPDIGPDLKDLDSLTATSHALWSWYSSEARRVNRIRDWKS